MDILQILTQFLIVLVGLFIYFLLKSFWPKYFETKGSNQATKEDIGEITEIVESIKTDLSQQTEQLKAQLSLDNQHLLNLKNAERDALFDFNRKFSAWLYYLVRFRLSSYKLENYLQLKDIEIEFSKRQYECDLAEAHLRLFAHDQDFLNLIRDLTISLLKYEEIVEIGIEKTYHEYSMAELQLKSADPARSFEIKKSLYDKLNPIFADVRQNM